MDDELESIAQRLDELAEELAELAIDQLKSAVRSGAGKTTAEEKRLTQARRAVEKAAHLVRSASGSTADDSWD